MEVVVGHFGAWLVVFFGWCWQWVRKMSGSRWTIPPGGKDAQKSEMALCWWRKTFIYAIIFRQVNFPRRHAMNISI